MSFNYKYFRTGVRKWDGHFPSYSVRFQLRRSFSLHGSRHMLYPRGEKNFIYAHVTGRIIERTWPHISLESVWEIFCLHLKAYAKPGGPQIHAFVLMNNHFHLLITEDDSKVAESAERLTKQVESSIQNITDFDIPIFDSAPEYFLIIDLKHLRHVYRYIYQNPVRAGLTQKVEDYPFSTLGGLLGRNSGHSRLPLVDTFGIIYDPMRMLRWINDLDGNEERWSFY